MRNIFDLDDGDFIFRSGKNNMGIDTDGHVNMRMGDNMSMDMETGELHITSSWRNNEDDE